MNAPAEAFRCQALAKEIAAELRAMENSSTTSSGLNGGRRTLDKQTFALEAIQKFARLTNTSGRMNFKVIIFSVIADTRFDLPRAIDDTFC
jgi:hypothetical protein